MAYWLIKSEPSVYSWAQFVKDGQTSWTGVRNAQAANNLKAMKPGDRCFFYHSNEGKEIVGIAEVVKPAYPDPTDQATIEEEYALELRARDRERKLLKKIGESLRRIEDGTYGWCEETGESIGIPRMLARPTATLSVEAQTRRELKQKLYGD